MLLITKISLGNFLSYKNEYINCLLHNANNDCLSNIFVFIDGHDKDFPKHNKIKYQFKRNSNDYNLIDFCRRQSQDYKIIWCNNPLIGFNEDLRLIENEQSLFKSKYFMIFNKDTKINTDLSIEEPFKKPNINLTDYSSKNSTSITDKIIDETSIRKKGEIVNSNEKTLSRNLDVIIISVNYNDFLITTLERNSIKFDNITVVTSREDKMCQEICNKFGAKLIVSEIMYEDGAKFNKGKAINLAIKSLKNPGFILLIDADIIVKEEINTEFLSFDSLYTSDRWMCNTYEDLLKIEKEGNSKNYSYNEVDKGLGFFQLFHYSTGSLYPESSENAAFSDLLFRDRFTKKESINNSIIHLGRSYQNWDGRKTERFLTDSQFQKIFNSINKIFNVNEYFDKIYCLNLDRRKDRWYDVSKVFNKHSIKVERFKAIDGVDILDEELLKINPKLITDEDASKAGLIENKNALACLRSHIEIIKQAKEKNYEKILIFEDDVILSDKFSHVIKKIKKLDWNFIYLGASQFEWDKIELKNGYYKSNNTLGTFAYAIKSELYDYLIELFESTNLSIDNTLSIFQQNSIFKCLTIYPNIVISNVSNSDIRDSKNLDEYSEKMKWNLGDFVIDKKNKNFEIINLSKEETGKKILFLININDVGGAEYVSYQHIKMCKKLGYRPVVVSAEKGMFFDKINELEVDLFYSELNKIEKSLILDTLKELSEDCEIIYNCNYFGITPYLKKLKELKEFEYYTIAHSDIEWVVNSIYEYDNITDKYIVIHDKIRNELNKKNVCNTRIFTIPNFVDYEEIKIKSEKINVSEIKKEIGINHEDYVIGMVTRISPDKNILDALKVIKNVSDKIENVKLLMVGDVPNRKDAKPYKDEIINYIKELGIEDKVIITGHIDNNEVYNYIKCFDLSINTSPSEGLPISMLEQMACGIHCIFPSHGEIPNVLENFGTVININQKRSFESKDVDNYIFGRYSDIELQPFVDEILKINKYGQISPEIISNQIKYTRNTNDFEYFFDFLYGGYKEGVTFLIRARNEEQNVEECIESILDVADEIIFVDHLSTDNTYQKVNEISKINKKVKLFKYDREVPKPGFNYRENVIKIGNSISNYYNFCLSKVTKKNIIKWDADFLGVSDNLSEMIEKFDLKNREDRFSLWFTGKTLFKHNNENYVNENSYYNEYRAFSMVKGVKWEDAIRCEYVCRNYADNSTSIRYENDCFYEIKRTNIDEFSLRESLIDKRDEIDYNILKELKENKIPVGLKLYRNPKELKFILICATGRSGSTALQRIINTIPNALINGENHGAINNLLQSYVNIKKASKLRENSIPKHKDGGFYDASECESNNIKPCWLNYFDIDDYKINIKGLITKLITNNHTDKKVVGFKEIRYYENTHLIDEFLELFPNTKVICHYKENINSQANSKSKNNWWTEKDKDHLLEYNKILKDYSSSRDFAFEFTFEKMFEIEEVKKLFDFLGEDIDIEKYQNIINNNLD